MSNDTPRPERVTLNEAEIAFVYDWTPARSDTRDAFATHLQGLLAAREEALHSWGGLMSLVDEHWPEDIFPTLPDDDSRDAGPRIVSLVRWVERLTAERDAAREALARVVAVLDDWGMLFTLPTGAGDMASAEDFAGALDENGAWRLARDLRTALRGEAR